MQAASGALRILLFLLSRPFIGQHDVDVVVDSATHVTQCPFLRNPESFRNGAAAMVIRFRPNRDSIESHLVSSIG